jgi:hypothetical protein
MRRILRPLAVLGAPLSRRAMLRALARMGIMVSAAPALSAAAGKDDGELRALAALVRELVPHAVDEKVYLDAARTLRGAMELTAGQIDDGLRRLRESPSTDIPEADALLAKLRTAAVEAIYRDPRVWERIGYGGNALAKGGYVASFNDIDWLPPAKEDRK